MKLNHIFLKIFLIFIIGLLYLSSILAQNFGSVKGKVFSIKDSSVIFGASVQIQGMTLGASTNKNGEFNINRIPPGQIVIVASMVGFHNNTISTKVESGKMTLLNIILEESQLSTEEVVITANKRAQTLSEIPVSVNVVEARVLEDRNIQTLDDALRYIP
jgi:iron complex outermembrane recepter protein